MRLHALDADLGDLLNIHAEHLAAFKNQRAVTFGGKFLVFPFFHERFDVHVRDSVRAHPGRRLNDAAQLIDRKQRLLHIRLRLHVIHN